MAATLAWHVTSDGMELQLPDDILRRAEASTVDLRIALAIQLYADNRIDYADACRLSSVAPAVFNRELISRALSIQPYPSAGKPHREAG